MGSGLEKSFDFGMFFFLAIPFLQCLIFFDRIFDNYGIAIIILTMILKFITLPLNSMSMKSMKKMQKVQPEILKIREKFKGEPQKMNAAVMELYKKNKVNPVSGCLPMLIQIPIFIALYRMLLVSIELKNSPFFGWISDLSLKDPYYVSPILMGISMFVQQRMTPSTAVDPMQQKIFMLMPVIFTFLFINFPSGLVLYWLVNNILTIAHQFYLNKKLT
jgi:YidC/Oxa1 family membrane protein insertase